MPPPSQNVVRTWRYPIHLLPVEILSKIFRLVVYDEQDEEDRVRLMLVCRHWQDILVSTPGIPSTLWIKNSTTIEMVRAAIQGKSWLLDVTIHMDDEGISQDFNADAFSACFIAAIGEASRWQSLWIHGLPRTEKCKAFPIVPPLKNLDFIIWLDQNCDLGGFFEPLMTAITTTATARLRNMNLQNLDVILYLMQPDCLHVFSSLTFLTIELSKRIESPANILPHLQRLEYFDARHLHLPFYPPDAPLPLVQTLRTLKLKSVSVQWMAGKVFPVLRECFITFPHQIDIISLQPVTMPACTSLTYESNDLNPLRYFHHLPLAALAVKSGQWNITRGNRQLVAICHMIVYYAQSLTSLDLHVRCSQKLLVYMLSLLPALESLKLRLESPRALSETFFQAFVAATSNVDSPCEMGAPPSLPICLKLAYLEVNYKRWLRGPERTALLLVFGEIASSRLSQEFFELILSFEGLAQRWFVLDHVEHIHEVAKDQSLVTGISSPCGIIPLVMEDDSMDYPLMGVPFLEVEYLVAHRQLSIDYLLTLHHLVELRVEGGQDILPSEPPPNLPLFHTLRVFEAENIHPSYLTGQTFHKLERCRMSLDGEGPDLSQDQVTQMPACTRLDVDDFNLLANLKLPQICELGASFDHPEFNMIWEKHIVVNANLSGLELLHVYGRYQQADLIQVLRCLPVLKSLILANGSNLDAGFFEEFILMHPNETTGLTQSHNEGHISPILCPMLSSLLIEGCDPIEQVELVPVLKQLVTLRAVCDSTLKRFILSAVKFRRKFELVGSQGGLVTEMDSLDEVAEPFHLDI